MEFSRDEIPSSDLEAAAVTDNTDVTQQHALAQQLITNLGEILGQADRALADLDHQQQEDGMVGSAIIRACQELADTLGSLASRLDNQSDDERRAMAQACLEDAQNNLLLMESMEKENQRSIESKNLQEEFSDLSEEDMMNALTAATTLLRDVEATLRSMDQDEADELADVAITVARLFIASMQSIQSTLTPEDLLLGPSPGDSTLEPSDRIELLEEVDEEERNNVTSSQPSTKRRSTKNSRDHLRVLWPPLGPEVSKAFSWGKEAAAQKPVLAVALGLTLWPAAIVTAVVGGPLVLADGFVQDLYANFEDGPVIQGLERGAAQVYQTGRLSFVCGKLVTRQTLRVVDRQLKRRGGAGKLAEDLGGMALDRVTHPVETIGMAWNGINWGVEKVKEAVEHLTDAERQETAHDLHQ